jgi:predicted nucleic acid-binding protein
MTPTATPMPDRIFLDTSFVIALINEKDQYHDQAEALSFRFANSALLTTSAVLLEIGNALAKDFRAEAISIIRVLSHSSRVELVEIDSNLMEKGLAVYDKYSDKKWGLVDCISFVVMREAGTTQVLTFDKDFEQAGFAVLRD